MWIVKYLACLMYGHSFVKEPLYPGNQPHFTTRTEGRKRQSFGGSRSMIGAIAEWKAE